MQEIIVAQNFNNELVSQMPTQANSDDQLIFLWLKRLSQKTQEAYQRDVLDFRNFAQTDLRQMTLSILESYKDKLGQNLQPSSVSRKLAAIKSLFSFGAKIGYLQFDIGRVITLPKYKNKIADRFLPIEIVEKIIEAETDLQNKLFLKLSYYLGARVSEVVNLVWGDFHLGANTCTVTLFGKGGKTRFVPLEIWLYNELLQLKGDSGRQDRVFKMKSGKRFSENHGWRVCDRISDKLKEMGIDQKLSPHFFRHSNASHALAGGANLAIIQKSLGHASISTTSMYLHTNPEDGSGLYLKRI